MEFDPSLPLRTHLLQAVLRFTRVAAGIPGVRRVALVGSLTTSKASPKDADVLVTIATDVDFVRLAKAGRTLKGTGQQRNSGADIFLADEDGRYIGRVCHYRECRPRVACHAQHCGRRESLNDDLDIVDLPASLVASPPMELWPTIVRRRAVPQDVEELLLGPLQEMSTGAGKVVPTQG